MLSTLDHVCSCGISMQLLLSVATVAISPEVSLPNQTSLQLSSQESSGEQQLQRIPTNAIKPSATLLEMSSQEHLGEQHL